MNICNVTSSPVCHSQGAQSQEQAAGSCTVLGRGARHHTGSWAGVVLPHRAVCLRKHYHPLLCRQLGAGQTRGAGCLETPGKRALPDGRPGVEAGGSGNQNGRAWAVARAAPGVKPGHFWKRSLCLPWVLGHVTTLEPCPAPVWEQTYALLMARTSPASAHGTPINLTQDTAKGYTWEQGREKPAPGPAFMLAAWLPACSVDTACRWQLQKGRAALQSGSGGQTASSMAGPPHMSQAWAQCHPLSEPWFTALPGASCPVGTAQVPAASWKHQSFLHQLSHLSDFLESPWTVLPNSMVLEQAPTRAGSGQSTGQGHGDTNQTQVLL